MLPFLVVLCCCSHLSTWPNILDSSLEFRRHLSRKLSSRDINISGYGSHIVFPIVGCCCNLLPILSSSAACVIKNPKFCDCNFDDIYHILRDEYISGLSGYCYFPLSVGIENLKLLYLSSPRWILLRLPLLRAYFHYGCGCALRCVALSGDSQR